MITASITCFPIPKLRNLRYLQVDEVGRDSPVGIATELRTGQSGDQISVGGEIYCTSLLYNGYRVVPGSKRQGRHVDHPPPSSAEVEGRVELYLYSPSGSSSPILG